MQSFAFRLLEVRKIKKIIPYILIITVITLIFSGNASAADLTNITKNMAADAQNTLNLKDQDNTLLITTAGPAKYKNSTTEDTLQTIKDEIPTITYSNILQLNKPNDPPTFTFVKKEEKGTYAIKYTITESGMTKTQKLTIGPNMTKTQFITASRELGYDILAIANAWATGAPLDMLKIAAWTGTVNDGLITAYAAAKQFIQNYPLQSEATSYHIITSVGGGDDDVPMFLMDSTPLKWNKNYYNFRSAYTNDPNENIYIYWDANTKTGKLLYWTINNKYKGPTGTLEELKHNQELLNLLATDPASLYKILKLATINDEQFSHLWTIGIDKEYISSLPNATETMKTDLPVLPKNNYNSLFENGQKAVEIANQAFKEAGLSPLSKEDLLITSAGYSQIQGLSYGAIDGIIASTGILLKNIYSLKRGAQTPLWYVFVKKPTTPDGPLYAVFIDSNGKIKPIIYEGVAYNVFDISAKNLEGAKGTAGYAKSLAVYEAYKYNIPSYAQQDYYIVSLANEWAIGMPYDFMLAAIGGGCPGSGLTQGYVIADIIKSWLPLTGNQYYIYLGVPAHCKEQVIMQVLGLSAGRGTYYTTGVRNTATLASSVGIAIKWDPSKNTGKAILIDYDKSILESIQPNNDNYYKTMYWAMWYLTSAFPGKELYSQLQGAYAIKRSVTLTETEYYQLLAAGDPIEYLLNFVDVTPPKVTATIKDSTLYMDINEDGTIYYSMDGNTWQQYTNPIKLEAGATIYYYAIDENGNKAETQYITVPRGETRPSPGSLPTSPTIPTQITVTPMTSPASILSYALLAPVTSPRTPTTEGSLASVTPARTPAKKAPITTQTKTTQGVSSIYMALIFVLFIGGALAYIKRETIIHAINNVKSAGK